LSEPLAVPHPPLKCGVYDSFVDVASEVRQPAARGSAMETIWLPALLIALAILLIIFGPSEIVRLFAAMRGGAWRLVRRVHVREHPAKQNDRDRSPEHAKMRRL